MQYLVSCTVSRVQCQATVYYVPVKYVVSRVQEECLTPHSYGTQCLGTLQCLGWVPPSREPVCHLRCVFLSFSTRISSKPSSYNTTVHTNTLSNKLIQNLLRSYNPTVHTVSIYKHQYRLLQAPLQTHFAHKYFVLTRKQRCTTQHCTHKR